jgi:hypothetical protein
MARLRQAEGPGPLTWIAFAGALMFMTSLNIAVGLSAAAALLSGRSGPDIAGALHSAAFVLAAPVALAGAAFFGATAVVSLTAGAFPRFVGWGAVIAAVANIGAISGIFSLTGPLNSGNGAIGGIAAPVLAWVAWILLVSLWLLTGTPDQRTSRSLDQPGLNSPDGRRFSVSAAGSYRLRHTLAPCGARNTRRARYPRRHKVPYGPESLRAPG